jgi:hypothetical protein
MGTSLKGRGRLSGIELLPSEASPVIAWAANELRGRDRTQTEIYEEFVQKLEALHREHRGELDFTIPSFSAFNRHAVKLATLARRLDETREITGVLAEKFDAKASDDLTVIAAEAIKTLIFEVLTAAGDAGIEPKDAMNLANALRAATQAQGVSTNRREKVEKQFAADVDKAVESVAKAKGLTSETVEAIKSQILGVRKE